MEKRFENILVIKSRKNETAFLIIALLLILISSGLVGCASKEVKSESNSQASIVKNTSTPTNKLPSENITDKPGTEVNQSTLTPESHSNSSQERNLSDYLNSVDSVRFQETVWQFAKAYFSSDKDEIKKYLADGVKPEVWKVNAYDKLTRLILKWNPEELSKDKIMDVQYEFLFKGDDSCMYLGMVLKYQNDKWLVQEYYLEK
ncbi:hypothetical protein [Caproiciproducens faecalis]|uniref:DUF4829 domain-containing protein n=1 Tax=Caproiciproducens faecalis TaxID=2820301 RepID=A0ABS7DJB7_9FIRM|nr:hypothetical protein [Caproiciproducens faecalis]MBW7571199.1 hypothetical protein [Caproiciproducens faecalis]